MCPAPSARDLARGRCATFKPSDRPFVRTQSYGVRRRVASGLSKTAPDETMRLGDASPARRERTPLWPVDPRTTEYLVRDSSTMGLGPTPSSQLSPDRALLSPSSSPRAPSVLGKEETAEAPRDKQPGRLGDSSTHAPWTAAETECRAWEAERAAAQHTAKSVAAGGRWNRRANTHSASLHQEGAIPRPVFDGPRPFAHHVLSRQDGASDDASSRKSQNAIARVAPHSRRHGALDEIHPLGQSLWETRWELRRSKSGLASQRKIVIAVTTGSEAWGPLIGPRGGRSGASVYEVSGSIRRLVLHLAAV
ncbi:hypothetical protein CDD80_6101 [Ophiocordyceps camponoti-rufipedis]|uniref:Uncharacterized protein n=1 Tax=Ophiocordyceps camponoti-rufipedis TaxID=2004952 RepID=A0A2C5YTG2_9HYPO|nr:hypothetical protein CDD80_6101 [Ophiocordyceps camponoti-rufipedis]